MENIIPSTVERVSKNTSKDINLKIKSNTIRNINIYKTSSDKILSDNIEKLNKEWDTERVLEAVASSVIVASSILGIKHSRNWFLVTGVAGTFLLQHSLQGWCPPLPLIRKMGIRTSEEINNEKIVYKMLRNDFENRNLSADELLKIAEK